MRRVIVVDEGHEPDVNITWFAPSWRDERGVSHHDAGPRPARPDGHIKATV